MVAQASQVIRLGKLIVACIDTHRGIRLGVFGQAGLVELGLREFATGQIAALVVNEAAPAGILPGRRADVDALGGKRGEALPVRREVEGTEVLGLGRWRGEEVKRLVAAPIPSGA